jgi:GT2 family glycosyltransferase
LRIKRRVSAIVTTRNRTHLLPRALDSILAQRRRSADFEIEVIVVDDASTDATSEVMTSYPDIRYLRHSVQRGAAAARNTGIEVSTGTYLAFLDDDDEWLPDKLSVQVAALETHPSVGLVYGQAIVAFGENRLIYPSPSAPSGHVPERLLFDNFCGIPAVPLMRREAVTNVGGFDTDLRTCEDYDLWLRLAFLTPFLFVPAPVAIYRKTAHGKQSGAVRNGLYATTLRRVVNRALDRVPRAGFDNDFKRTVQATTELRIADGLATAGDFAGAWQQLGTALRICPRIVLNPGNRQAIATIVGRYAVTTDSFSTVTNAFRRDTGSLLGKIRLRDHLRFRHLLGDVDWEVSVAHGRGAGCLANGWVAGTSALRSFWHYSSALRFQSIARPLARGMVHAGATLWPRRQTHDDAGASRLRRPL